jgi:hypothetical protein
MTVVTEAKVREPRVTVVHILGWLVEQLWVSGERQRGCAVEA